MNPAKVVLVVVVALVLQVSLFARFSFEGAQPDVMVLLAIAAGFVIRALSGAAAVSVPVTWWFATVVALGALAQFLARRSAAVPGPVFAPAPSNPVFVPPAPDPAWGRQFGSASCMDIV